MDNTEIKAMQLSELEAQLASAQENLRKLKFAHAISPIENPLRIRSARRLVARLQTEITVKRNAAVASA